MERSINLYRDVQYELLTTDDQLHELCRRLAGASVVGLDTEFVSEYSYRPELCLVQVAVDGKLSAIDALMVSDLTPLWTELAAEGTETIVHAGREEFRFCLQAIGRRPCHWWDVQIAAGMVGMDYPSSYAKLVAGLLGQTLPKGETRTDWRRRPLSRRQLEYAMYDVVNLMPMRDDLHRRLDRLGRLDWFDREMTAWQDDVERSEGAQRWRRVSGASGLSSRSLAIVRELWQWREDEAMRRNCPTRRVLRDDLIVELARRGTADRKRIEAVRGLQRGDLMKKIPQMSQAIAAGLQVPDAECPERFRGSPPSQVQAIAQFLAAALASICRSQNISPGLVGSVQDVRELVAYHLSLATNDDNSQPALAHGWRAEIVGEKIEQLLAGQLAIRIKDPLSDEPLSIEPAV
jgi:ribonuclease D